MTRYRFLTLAVVALLSSCASPGYKTKPGNPASLVVGVKEFTTPGYAKLSAGDRGVHDYEHLALPAMLVQALSRTPGVSKAYFVPAGTVAVDIIVDGAIIKSNGRDLTVSLQVARMDGKVLGKQQVTLTHQPSPHVIMADAGRLEVTGRLPGTTARDPRDNKIYVVPVDTSKDVSRIRAADEGLFNQAASLIAGMRQKYASDPEDLRALVYAGSKKSSTPELVRMGMEAAKVEREHLCAPLTSTLVPRISATAGVYHQWQKESVLYLNAKEDAELDKKIANINATIHGVLSIANFALAGANALQGNTSMANMGSQAGMRGAADFDRASAAASVAQNKVSELQAALARQKQQFSTGLAREITVRIYNKVVTLRGSKEQMTDEFRRVVKEEMNKELARSAGS